MSKPVLPAKRRRKGFESVRKGYRSADARLMFFEKEKVYCKLTVASDIRKGLLHVSLGAVGSWSFAVLKQGLINLEASCEGERVVTFCIVQKVTKKHARTCKKLPVASFCASETAETGRIANGRKQGDHFSRRLRFANLWTPGTIQSSAESEFAKFFGGTCRNRFCLQNAGVKALNRCERVIVVQTQD